MPQCAVATCRNSHRRTRGRRIRYHRFPQIPEVRQRWVRACGRPPLSNGDIPFNIQTARICSLHFTNDSYEKDMEHLVLGLPVRSRLRRGAVPTIGVPVNVQPVTKMLVEDAKRSLLKQAAANSRASNNNKQLHAQKSQQQQQAKKSQRLIGQAESAADLHAGYDVLLALGLTPATNLNKMHTMEGDEKKAQDSPVDLKQCAADAEQELNNKSPKMPQSQQNGAALPEEAASAERLIGNVTLKKEPRDSYDAGKQHSQSFQAKSPKMHADQSKLGRAGAGQQQRGISTKSSPFDDYHHQQQQQQLTSPYRETRKRRSLESSCHAVLSANGSPSPKKFCTDQREQYINSLIGSDKFNAEQLAARADQLRAEVQDLDELARAKEMEWNEILSMRKLKEEAYLRIERRRQIMGFMESNGTDAALPLASLSLALHHQQQQQQQQHQQQQQQQQEMKKEDRHSRASSKATANYHPPNKQQHQQQPNQQLLENGPKQQQLLDLQNSEHNRQIGEGRQGAIVDVRSIIADYRLRHPAETVPKRRGRRMRNSVNVGLGAGGAMVETLGGMDSRPSSTDSCKSNTNNLVDPNTTMSFKDVLVQFAKLSQQQGEPIKTPQNYPDVTLHPVVPTPTTAAVTSSQSSNPPSSGSLLHGILTKSQSPRPTTFSPTLARLLTAPERERNSSASITNLQPSNAHLAHAYQGANPVSISNFLSSSKARTEITITPVVNNMSQSQANNLIHVDDGDDEVIEEKDSRLSMGARDNKEDREVPPRCQGCHERTAQFVCAGCGNQWYCSRECQVAAWDDHSEVCSG
ncbi:dendritic arbor reduction protein 1-like isoform X4 [Trichogramma pretiosum]|uniref:dendritic arbor reduction protein 1-like isoform X4 n=1 Tax=Trichogramma pretiosum TaxID=7493 RepID=UPI000C71AE02|nr:dendritic arbor reduction protein 1-like isoform X4 [Trichogramma pretiosum]